MRLVEVFALVYLTAVCAAQDDSGTKTTPEQIPPTTKFVLPVPILQLNSGRSDLYTSEVVTLSCTVGDGSDWTIKWKKNGENLSQGSEFEQVGSLLTINANSNSLSGKYTCHGQHKARGHETESSPPVDITVTEPPKPKMTLVTSWDSVFVGEAVTLRCEVSESGWTFSWYKDQTSLNEEGTFLDISSVTKANGGKYSCKAHLKPRGVSSTDSNSQDITVNDPPTPTLKLLTPWTVVFEGEALRLSCEVPNTGWTFSWYKDQTSLNVEGPTLYISSVTKTDKGKYTCKAEIKPRGVSSTDSNSQDITVYEKSPEVSVSRSVDFNPMYPGESISLECSVDLSSEWKYEWHHNGKDVKPSNSYMLNSIDHSHAGDYQCKVKREEGLTYESKILSFQVSDPPTPTLKLLTPWTDVFEGEALRFSCAGPNTGWTFSWYKDQTSLNVEGPTLDISSVTKTDKGKYTCKAEIKPRGVSSTDSDSQDITVYEKSPEVSVSRSVDFNPMYPGESISLECNVDLSSEWKYEWHHNGKDVKPSNSYMLNSIDHSHAGDYQCKVKREGGLTYESKILSFQVSDPPTPTLKLLTPWTDVFEREALRFSCAGPNTGWTFSWYKDQTSLNVEGPTLDISSVTKTDKGKYTCKAEIKPRGVSSTDSDSQDITVYEKYPQAILKRSSNYDMMYPGERMTFTCRIDVSSGWEYVFYYNNTVMERSTFKEFKLFPVTRANSGSYKCSGTRSNQTIQAAHSNASPLLVSEIPIPTVNRVTHWLDVFPSELVKLKCRMQESSAWVYTWYRDTEELQAGNGLSFDTDGATLSISEASKTHVGNYSCSGRLEGRSVSSSKSEAVRLHVYDAKPEVTVTSDQDISVMHTDDSVTFTCNINVSTGWTYEWHKDGRLLSTSTNQHVVKEAKSADSGSYQCRVKRGQEKSFPSELSPSVKLQIEERPQASIILKTGWSDVFSTDNLLLRCEVSSDDMWNYTWFKAETKLVQAPTQEHSVTPKNDPDQSLYQCRGIRSGRPSYSKLSESFRTKNLLLKRRILLSISGCIFFGIIFVFLGCILLRICRKPAPNEDKAEEANLFLTMAQLKDCSDTPCPLVEYISDADLNPPAKADEDGALCSETTPLPISTEEEQAKENQGTAENGGGMVSFLH